MIGKKEYEAQECMLHQSELFFYEENPRIYSIVKKGDAIVTQQCIEEVLSSLDHVKQLRTSIEQNGGLIDPLIVVKKIDQYIVLEGNSRLAAYRLLAKKDPMRWKDVRCYVLPNDISDDHIFTLLGQYHLIGRKNWSPFEQAAYLYRQKELSGLASEIFVKSIGLTLPTAKQYIDVYKFMLVNDDLISDRWSHYYEYLKSRGIKKYRETNSDIDTTIVSQIKSDTLKAVDIRDKLGKIANGKNKISTRLMKEIIEQKITLSDAAERFESTGKTGGAYIAIRKFKETIHDDTFQAKVKRESSASKENAQAIAFELKKIKIAVENLIKEING